MPDLDKVIKGLECCAAMDGSACRECPYSSECVAGEATYQTGTAHLAADALELLKAQEVDIKALSEKYAELLDRTLEAVPPEKRELPFGMYDAVKYEYKCGACGCGLMKNEKWRANYCPECGKAVKWDEPPKEEWRCTIHRCSSRKVGNARYAAEYMLHHGLSARYAGIRKS